RQRSRDPVRRRHDRSSAGRRRSRRRRPLRAVAVRSIPGPAHARQGATAARTEDPVNEVETAVTNTHALLYHATTSPKLGQKAARHFTRTEQKQTLVYIPAAVIWEI